MNESGPNCSNEYPSTTILYHELKSSIENIVLTSVCGVLCFLMIILFLEELWFLVHYCENKRLKKKYIYLVGLYPIISVSSLVLLLVPVTTLAVEIVASTYISYAIFTFTEMITVHFDGISNLLTSMKGEKLGYATPPLCCLFRCLNNISFTSKSYKFARFLVIQIVFIRPLTTILILVLWLTGQYTPGDESDIDNATFFIVLAGMVSTLLAVWGLIVLFRASRTKLKEHSIVLKFASLQSAIIFCNVQFIVINVLSKSGRIPCEGAFGPAIRGVRIHHFLLIMELFLVSILARFAYRHREKQTTFYMTIQ